MKPSKFGNGRKRAPMLRSWLEDFWGTDKFFDDDFFPFRRTWMPAVNIKENDENFEIEVAAPGLKKDDFNVSVEQGRLCISAELEEKVEEKEDNYTRREFNYRSFERNFTLPENVDPENIKAKYTDGMLTLTLVKKVVKKPSTKTIAIN